LDPEPDDPSAAHHVDIALLAASGDVAAFEGDALVAKLLRYGTHPAIQVTAARFAPALVDGIEEQEETAQAVCSSSR
jgi:hypothetical protein